MEPRPHSPACGQEGFSIVEVMVAMLILIVGVLGTFTILQGSLSSTSATKAREQGTNLARDLIERSRQVPYAATTTASAPGQLRATLPDAGALNGSSFPVQRRDVAYTVTVAACSIDDPSDGAGLGDASFCAAPGPISGPGSAPTGNGAALNVLGVSVAAAGSLLGTVCNAVGTNTAILANLTAAVSSVAPVSACGATSSGSVAFDSRPDDLRRVRVTVGWTQAGEARSLTQTTLLTNALPNDCPITTPVAPATLPVGCPTPTT